MDNPTLQIVMRYIHLLSAMLIVGGMAFISFCVRPAVRLLDDSFSQTVTKLIHDRFMRVVYAGIAGLLISGVYNWILQAKTYKDMGPKGNALIGAKVLLAAIMFCIVFARSIGWIKPSKFWHMFNLHVAAVVILLAGILHYLRLEHIQTLSHLLTR